MRQKNPLDHTYFRACQVHLNDLNELSDLFTLHKNIHILQNI